MQPSTLSYIWVDVYLMTRIEQIVRFARQTMSEAFTWQMLGPADLASLCPTMVSQSPGGVLPPRPEDFPALPGTSKAAKKRAKQKEAEHKSMAARLGGGHVRVLNKGAAHGGAPASSGMSASSSGQELDAMFPTLRHSASAPSLSDTAPAVLATLRCV